MNIKAFYKSHYLTSHLILLALVVILLSIGVGFGLDIYTHHGERIIVPDLKGMSFDKAYNQLIEKGIQIQVSDSGYNKKLPANTILAQTPNSGMAIKEGHIVYVTVNSPSSPTFTLPDIIDNSSLREAEARLSAMGFQLTAPQKVEGEKDWVYGITSRGRRVSNGDRLSIDHPLTLMVGKGTTEDVMETAYEDSLGVPVVSEVDEFVEVKE